MDNNGVDTSGFYKLEDENWLYAQNFVYAKDYELLREFKDTYTFPIDGWVWLEEEPV